MVTVSSPATVVPKTSYVIMPFSATKSCSKERWDEIFEKLFKPTFENLGYQCSRSKASVGLLIEGILDSLHCSEIILADITDARPNVFYELGIAHAITNRTIMVTQDLSSVPSDLKPYSIIQYDADTKDGYLKFGRDVAGVVRRLLDPKVPAANPVMQFLGLNIRTLEAILERPVALLECANCHKIYRVPIGGMDHGAGIGGSPAVACGHWEPSIFRGLVGFHG